MSVRPYPHHGLTPIDTDTITPALRSILIGTDDFFNPRSAIPNPQSVRGGPTRFDSLKVPSLPRDGPALLRSSSAPTIFRSAIPHPQSAALAGAGFGPLPHFPLTTPRTRASSSAGRRAPPGPAGNGMAKRDIRPSDVNLKHLVRGPDERDHAQRSREPDQG
jgi:hypothetical protein